MQWADQDKGDGGVDVTGAPKSRPVEGAGFGRLLGLSGWKRSSRTGSFLSYGPVTVTIGGSNF